jgi:hypothetical protein
MAEFGFDVKGAVDSAVAKIKDPFNRYFRTPLDMKGALERNDFPDGFVITPYNRDGKELKNDAIRLRGDMAPIVPFMYGGTQKMVADYYPGNSEPTVQVLGPQESEITVNGRLKAKHFSDKIVGEERDADLTARLREIPLEFQKSIELIRLNGFLVQIQLGEFSRWGFIKEASFELTTVADIRYKITFLIVGFNKPRDYIIVSNNGEVPFAINKQLVASAAEFQNDFGTVPPSMPKSFADQISENVAAVAEAINLVTGFVDNILNEVDSIKDAVSRAQGLIKNARNTITTLQRRVGAITSFGGVSTFGGNGIAASYTNASFVANTLSSSYSLTAFLAAIAAQLKQFSDKLPIARHRVQDGDTLQNLAIKFYNDSSKWDQIYDHNRLQTTVLVKGSILEIPRI